MTTPTSSRWLKSTEWLAGELGKPDVAVIDGSYYLPTQNRDARAEYAAAHIPGAVFFDIDGVADHTTGLPHMLPTPGEFSKAVGSLGIGDGDTGVAYDGAGLFSAPRLWWTLKAMGHDQVKVLDGGFPKWRREGRAVESGPARPARPCMKPSCRLNRCTSAQDRAGSHPTEL